jgi:hypothetical protein
MMDQVAGIKVPCENAGDIFFPFISTAQAPHNFPLVIHDQANPPGKPILTGLNKIRSLPGPWIMPDDFAFENTGQKKTLPLIRPGDAFRDEVFFIQHKRHLLCQSHLTGQAQKQEPKPFHISVLGECNLNAKT